MQPFLDSWTGSYPCSVTSERTSSVVRVIVLKARAEFQLICTEIKPAIQDRRAISMLDETASHQRLDDIIVCRHRYLRRPARRQSIHRLIHLALQCIDIEYRIVLARKDIHPAVVVGSEARLLGPTLTWILHSCKHLVVAQRIVNQHILAHLVETTTRQDTPVDIATGESNAVATDATRIPHRSIPGIDRTAIVDPNVALIRLNNTRIE